MNDLIKRMSIMSGMLSMGEKVAFGSDASMIDEAAREIEKLQAQLEGATSALLKVQPIIRTAYLPPREHEELMDAINRVLNPPAQEEE